MTVLKINTCLRNIRYKINEIIDDKRNRTIELLNLRRERSQKHFRATARVSP